MKTVFIVIFHDIESDEILGVYASSELAEVVRKQKSGGYKSLTNQEQFVTGYTSEHWEACKWIGADIEEHEIHHRAT